MYRSRSLDNRVLISEKAGHEHTEDPSNKFLEILNTRSKSIKKDELEIWRCQLNPKFDYGIDILQKYEMGIWSDVINIYIKNMKWKFLKILNMGSVSIQTMTWQSGNMGSVIIENEMDILYFSIKAADTFKFNLYSWLKEL